MPIGTPQRVKRRNLAYDDFNGAALRAEWTKTDTENKVSVSGGSVAFAGGRATPAFNDPKIVWGIPQYATSGLTFECEATFSAFGTTGVYLGMRSVSGLTSGLRPAFLVRAAGVLAANTPTQLVNLPVTLVAGTSYRFRITFRGKTTGAIWSYSSDGGKTWVALWVDTADYSSFDSGKYWFGFNNQDASFTSSYAKFYKGKVIVPVLSDAFASRTAPGRADTGQPWLSVSGKAVPTFTSNDMRIPAGSTESWLFAPSGVADGVWEADLNFGSAPSTSKVAFIVPKHKDTSNQIEVSFSRAGQQITIKRVTVGVTTTIATLSSAGFADNTAYHMRVVCVGSSIWVYQDGVFKLSSSDSAFQYVSLCSFYLNDNLATPDIRWDNVQVWGIPRSPLMLDTFDRPDAAVLGNADTGQAYSILANVMDGPPSIGVSGGRAIAEVLGTAAETFGKVVLPSTSFIGSFVWNHKSSGGVSQAAGALIRALDGTNYIIIRVFSQTGNSVDVLRNLAGVRSALASTSFTFSHDTDYIVAYVLLGNVLEVYVNGTRIISTTITDFVTSPAGGPMFARVLFPSVDDLRYYATANPITIHDTFTRADSAATMGSTETPGTPYTIAANNAGVTVAGITSNKAYFVSAPGGSSDLLAVVPTAMSDVSVGVTVNMQASKILGAAVRYGDTSNYLAARLTESGDQILLLRNLAGVRSTVALGSLTINAATAYVVRAEAKAGIVNVYVDGVLYITYPDPDFSTNRMHGLYAGATSTGTSNTFDDLTIKEAV